MNGLTGQFISYPAVARHPDPGEMDVEGMVQLDFDRLVFESESHGVSMMLDHLEIDQSGRSGLVFTDSSQPGWEILCNQWRILSNPMLARRNHLMLRVKELRRRQTSAANLRRSVILVAVFAVVFTILYLSGGFAVRFAVSRVSLAWEAELGEAALKEIEDEVKFSENPGISDALESMLTLITTNQPGLKYPYKVHVALSSEPNAFALPGGTIIVTSGLFSLTKDPGEIAGVLAHEVAHVRHRHGLETLITSVGPLYVLKLLGGDRNGFVTVLSRGSHLLVSQHYSRQHEHEADETGFRMLVRAQINPQGMISLLRKLREHANAGDPDSDSARIFSSHPPTLERIAHLESLSRRLKHDTNFISMTLPALEASFLK